MVRSICNITNVFFSYCVGCCLEVSNYCKGAPVIHITLASSREENECKYVTESGIGNWLARYELGSLYGTKRYRLGMFAALLIIAAFHDHVCRLGPKSGCGEIGFHAFPQIFRFYAVNEAHIQCSSLDNISCFTLGCGPPGKYLYLSPPIPPNIGRPTCIRLSCFCLQTFSWRCKITHIDNYCI